MDIFLVFSAIIALGVLLVIGFYILVHFSHSDDKNDAYFPKFVVITGFVLAGCTVLLLPLDVANNEGYAGCDGYNTKVCGGLNMILLWEMFFVTVLIYLVVLIPFSVFFYEADDGTLMGGPKQSRLKNALIWQSVVTFIVSIIFTVFFFLLSTTDIPVKEYDAPSLSGSAVFYTDDYTLVDPNMAFSKSMLDGLSLLDVVTNLRVVELDVSHIEIQVNVITFFTAFLCFGGWLVFCIFGGVGLASIPIDLIMRYLNRPAFMDAADIAKVGLEINTRVNDLVEVGELIKVERERREEEAKDSGKAGTNSKNSILKRFFCGGKKGKSKRQADKLDRQTILQFKQAVFLLENDVKEFQDASDAYQAYNPLLVYMQLVLGVYSLILSLLWVVHIVVYVLPDPPWNPFLNVFVQWIDSCFPLFGVLAVAIFSLYLLAAGIMGCFKMGLRFLFFTLYPMKYGATYMSSFLFNIALVLLCSVPVVQFSVNAFADYARYTNIIQTFGVQIKNLQFFRFFFEAQIFENVLLLMTIWTAGYLILKPVDKPTNSLELRDRLLKNEEE